MREKIEPQMEGFLHREGFIKVIILAARRAMMLLRGLYWLGTQTGSYRCCSASRRAVIFSIALTEEQEVCRKSPGPQRLVEVGPGCHTDHRKGNSSTPSPPCKLTKDVSKWFLLNMTWHDNTCVHMSCYWLFGLKTTERDMSRSLF